jgi:hypothetical protein
MGKFIFSENVWPPPRVRSPDMVIILPDLGCLELAKVDLGRRARKTKDLWRGCMAQKANK